MFSEMKKIFTSVILACSLVLSAKAMTVNDAAGVYAGNLNIGGTNYNNKEVYILPGVAANTITFVLPDFKYNTASLGDIVLVNIPMNTDGQLTLESASLYIKAISERAEISVVNGLEDGGTTYNSIVSASSTQVLLSIAAPSLPEPIMVLFAGNKVTDKNYAVNNGGFEGNWSNNEVSGWHSFPTATGDFASFVTGNTDQFQRSTEKRPGSTGSQSVRLQSNLVLGAKANGNCTNGRINAGATTADSPANNYNFSDPSNSNYNTPFVGQPDSLVFWAKYIPADNNPNNSVNKARAHVAITTNARYQDPETGNSASVKIADAAINYSATSTMGWQRLSTPFTYTSLDPSQAAYMLITFTTNMTPGGGSTYKEGGSIFGGGTNHLDNIYLDDVEMIYNHSLTSLKMNGSTVAFSNGAATTNQVFSDSEYNFVVTTNGKASKSFIGYDAEHNQVHVYVVPDNYSQARAYSLYTLSMAEPVPPVWDTEYSYAASTCDNEPYSDELFQNLTEGGTYQTTIPNTQGGDSLITLTLTILPTYAFAETAEMNMEETYTWHEKLYHDLIPGVYRDTLSLQTLAGCDSVYTLTLTVKPIAYAFDEIVTACQNEETSWHGKLLPTAEEGTFVLYDSLKSVYGMDSVYRLTLTVLPTWRFEEKKYVNEADLEWRGKTIKDLPQAAEPYLFYDSLKASNGCDSLYVLVLYVSDIPVAYGEYEAVICAGESVTFEGVTYSEAFKGDIHVDELNVLGGDSIVRLTVTVLPSYTIEEYMTVNQGSDVEWEGYRLGNMDLGEMTLSATYYTVDDCDSTLVLHLTVRPIATGMETTTETDKHCAQKVFYNGHLYIIREDESIYDILGKKIK